MLGAPSFEIMIAHGLTYPFFLNAACVMGIARSKNSSILSATMLISFIGVLGNVACDDVRFCLSDKNAIKERALQVAYIDE